MTHPACSGSVLFLLWAAIAGQTQGQTFTSLGTFSGKNGEWPNGSLVQGPDGRFYGTTYGGRREPSTVFSVTAPGSLQTFQSFVGQSLAAGLVLGSDGNYYGTMATGPSRHGAGAVFKMTPDGAVAILHRFNANDGARPAAPLIEGRDGLFYGTTSGGGAGGGGTVFKITRAGKLTTLYNFCVNQDCTHGAGPATALVQASDGNFYGTTSEGGRTTCGSISGCGTIFRITPHGELRTIHYACAQPNCADGGGIFDPLIQAADGNLYGVAWNSSGGSSACLGGCGTVFKLGLNGQYSTLYTFANGEQPGGLIQATDGNFYGTTGYGGGNGKGSIFMLTPDGALHTLYSFPAGEQSPFGPLLQGTDGNFYGTTFGSYAVANDMGSVFRLSVGLPPFVTTVPRTGKIGSQVTILGTNLSGTDAVSFNGTLAAFTVNATRTAISAAVPAGATSGIVQVHGTAGTLSSNLAFEVTP